MVQPEFESAHIFCLPESSLNNEVAEYVGAARLGFKWPIHVEDQVGLTQLPSVLKPRNVGSTCLVAFWLSCSDPSSDTRDLPVIQPTFSNEVSEAWFGRPRRHVTPVSHIHD